MTQPPTNPPGFNANDAADAEAGFPIARLCDADAQALDALLKDALGHAATDSDSQDADAGSTPPSVNLSIEPSINSSVDPSIDAPRRQAMASILALLDQADHSDPQSGLSHEQALTPPDDLVAKTLAHVQAKADAETQRMRFAHQVDMLTGPQPGLGISFRQVFGAAAVFLLSVTLLWPVLANHQNSQEKALCEANMASMGSAFGSYAQSHKGQLPRQNTQPGQTWWSIGSDPSHSNSAQLFLLVRSDYLTVGQMTCPSHQDITDDEISALGGGGFVDFQRPGQISYSYANQFTAKPMLLDQLVDRPIVADKNPLFVAKGNQMVFDPTVSFDAPSIAHRGTGHNVLLADGHVRWSDSPEVQSPNGQDNIWTIQGQKTYTGKEIPTTNQDAFLSP